MNTFLGIELGSTRIKAMTIDEAFQTVSAGSYTWAASYENGVWTYPLEEVWTGLKTALSNLNRRESIAAMGISAMMHGYLAFDRDWNLLVPFRTWQNTSTGPAATELTELFGFNIPQRWSVAHCGATSFLRNSDKIYEKKRNASQAPGRRFWPSAAARTRTRSWRPLWTRWWPPGSLIVRSVGWRWTTRPTPCDCYCSKWGGM